MDGTTLSCNCDDGHTKTCEPTNADSTQDTGCRCRTADGSRKAGWPWAILATLGALLLRRRRHVNTSRMGCVDGFPLALISTFAHEVRRKVLLGSGFSVLLGVLSSCGARTELELPEVCPMEGETRECQDVCGPGVESCSEGKWGGCEVPVLVRACADDCGPGEDRCTKGAWQGCKVPEIKRPCESVCGPANETCKDGWWGRCDAPSPKPPKLKATIRDFSPQTHPDFQSSLMPGLDVGIVEQYLGDDDKPVYGQHDSTKGTTGKERFDQWYHYSPVSQSAPLDLQLEPSPEDAALFVYDNHAFFPIDGQLLGNEGRSHNFHFTLEASTTFQYVGGEVFSFAGDDDMWVFINRQLAIDLGGLHTSLSADIALDDIAGNFKLVKGEAYSLHLFFAERHTSESNFTIHTSIAEPGSCE